MSNTTQLSFGTIRKLCTKSGLPITIGTGTGTKWQWLKKDRPETEQNTLIEELVNQLLLTLKNGFNHIDTAEVYTTHPEVREAIKRSGILRKDLWITTKFATGFREVMANSKSPNEFIEKALIELGTDYIDMILIHTPFFRDDISYGQTIESAWKELIEIKKSGKARYIGVSNFAIPHLERVFKICDSPDDYPAVNQVEFHPMLQTQSNNIIKFCKDKNILVEGYGVLTPLFRIEKNIENVKNHPLKHLLQKLASKYCRTEAQILLRYAVDKEILPITTSSKEERIKEAINIYDFSLSGQDIEDIDRVGSQFSFRGFFDKEFIGLE